MKENKKYTFKKNERLNSRKIITQLIAKGKVVKAFPFYVRYLIVDESDSDAKILISVAKRRFKRAVDRNKIKRLIREAYRIKKESLYEFLAENNLKIVFFVSFVGAYPDYEYVSKSVEKMLNLICIKIKSDE
ncbi:MAG: ribonuclease P protein component [Bacteroidales bacterium]|nr:ribonuclease P protein component [Bacteroidales bacterium]